MASNGNGNGAKGSTPNARHWATAPTPPTDAALWLPVSADDAADADAPAMQVQALLAVATQGREGAGGAGVDADVAGPDAGSTPAELTALIKAALADHDAIMAASFSFSDVARQATRDDFMALLDQDDEEPIDDPHLQAVAEALDSCPFTRWRARLAWLEEVPAEERSLIDELERLIIEPAVTWRELELEWQEANAVATAAAATAVSGPTVVCLDARTAARVEPEQVSDQNWTSAGDGDDGQAELGRLSLSVFGLPSDYSRYRLVLFTGDHLRRLLGPGSTSDGDEIVMPSLELIERHAPELLGRLLPPDGLPPIALPWFTGRLTPYGDKSALNWTSPPVGPVRLRSEDILLACLF